MTVAQVAIGLLRQQLAPGQLMHGIVTNGGQAVNVIPGRATLQYAMRAIESDSLRELEGRIFACFAAGALATGCEYEIDEPAPAYAELKSDAWLSEICRGEMLRLGRDPVAPEFEAGLPMGSTDMGNVTQVLPGIHPVIGVDAGGATVHQRAFAAAAAGPSADRAVLDGAIMLARAVVQLAETPAQRDRVLAAQERRAGSMSLAAHADAWLAAHYDDLVEWRRHIHRYPELGRQEYATTQFVAERLADAGPRTRRCCPPEPGSPVISGPTTSPGSRCGPTWMRCPWPSGPARRTPRRCPTSRTPAGMTRILRSCWAPR